MRKAAVAIITLLLYGIVTIIYTWPTAVNFTTHVIGGSSDTYQFMWGMWQFGEAVEDGCRIWQTPDVLYPYGAPLIQHDYPIIPNFIAYICGKSGLTLTASYNFCILLAFILNAFSIFLLVKALVKTRWLYAFFAGFIFAFAPYFIARPLHGHFSVTHAYPLVLYILCLHKTYDEKKTSYAILTGLFFVATVYCSFYYAVYALVYFLLYNLYTTYSFRLTANKLKAYPKPLFILLIFNGFLFLIFAIVIHVTGGTETRLMGANISVTKNSVVMIIWWISWLAAFLIKYRVRLGIIKKHERLTTISRLKQWGIMLIPSILLLPLIIEAVSLIIAGDYASQSISWKSGPAGAYPLALLLPNVNNFLWGDTLNSLLSDWELFESGINGIGWASILILLCSKIYREKSWWRFGFFSFIIFSFGPFLRIAPGFEHGPVMPFWFMRYIPLIDGARIPNRWTAVYLIMLAILVAKGLEQIRSNKLKTFIFILALFEATSVPLRTDAVIIPEVYKDVAGADRKGAVLELPFGVHDGRRHFGYKYRGQSLYYQTAHKKPIIGGYISRVPDRIFRAYSAEPVLQKLIALKDHTIGKKPSIDYDGEFRPFLNKYNIRWIVLDISISPKELIMEVNRLLGKPQKTAGNLVLWEINGPID